MIKSILFFVAIIILVFGLSCSREKKEDYSSIIDLFAARKFTDSELNSSLLYRFYTPQLHLDSHKLPLILYLSSSGPRGNDNRSQIEFGARVLVDPAMQQKHKCYVLVPQCPKGRQWLNTPCSKFPKQSYNQELIPESNEMKMIIKLINNLAAKYPIDTNRIYVTGISMGGSGTWDIVTRYPNFFAAAAPLNGVSDPSIAHLVAHLPVWAFHGRQDKISDVNNTRKMIAALKENGSSCQYTEYPESGHGIAMPTYTNNQLFDWMFSQDKAELK